MVSKQLLEMLVCPVDKTPLTPADSDLMARLNRQIASGGVVNRAGVAVEQGIEAGLVRQDGKLLYIVRDEIPLMLADEAIPLDQIDPEDA